MKNIGHVLVKIEIGNVISVHYTDLSLPLKISIIKSLKRKEK